MNSIQVSRELENSRLNHRNGRKEQGKRTHLRASTSAATNISFRMPSSYSESSYIYIYILPTAQRKRKWCVPKPARTHARNSADGVAPFSGRERRGGCSACVWDRERAAWNRIARSYTA